MDRYWIDNREKGKSKKRNKYKNKQENIYLNKNFKESSNIYSVNVMFQQKAF